MYGSFPMANYGNNTALNPNMMGGMNPNQGMNGANFAMMSQMAMLTGMMKMMMQIMQQFGLGGMQNGGGGLLPAQAGFGGSGGGGGGGSLGDFLGNSNGGGSSVAAPGAAPEAGNAQAASPVKIGPGTRVLEIGDSHSVGTFGQELDAKLRGTGAQVSTYASAGATASSFVNGSSNKYGYWEKKANGSEKKVGYGTSQAAPKLDSLIAQEKPHVILVNLGANFRGGNPKSEVDKIGQIAKKHGIPIVWVGPPKTAKDNSNSASIQQFDQQMAAAVAPYGKYVPSSNLTPKYSGGDGLHYSGSEGTQIAKQWAGGVFNAVTGG